MKKEHNRNAARTGPKRSVTWAGRGRSVTWAGRTMTMLLTVALILPMIMAAPDTVSVSAASPDLLAIASQTPDTTVAVIAQAAGDSGQARALAVKLGATITSDLHIINAFGADLPAGAARKLAESGTVRWISLDGAVESTSYYREEKEPFTPEHLNTYLDTVNVRPVWEMGYDGSGVGVAVVDSGIGLHSDLGIWSGRISEKLLFTDDLEFSDLGNSHGTHVAGIIGGSGTKSEAYFKGIAPGVNFYSLRVSKGDGISTEADVVEALQWVYDNRETTNIRVVNLSLNASTEQSYHNSPMDAAVEILWFNGIVVICSAGNTSGEMGYNPVKAAPANDPFIITVGATHEQGTADRADDSIGTFSASGTTTDGFAKPDVLAPGKDIVSTLGWFSKWRWEYPERVVNDSYFRLSGTSMAAPMVSGAVALMLQAEPDLTPDQVKYRLMNSGSQMTDARGDTVAYLDVYELLTTPTAGYANDGTEISHLLTTGEEGVALDSVSWNAVSWNAVSWNAVSWNAVSWNAVSWNAVSWNAVSWSD